MREEFIDDFDVKDYGHIPFHMLFLDGMYVERPDGSVRFHWVKAPTSIELTELAHTMARRYEGGLF